MFKLLSKSISEEKVMAYLFILPAVLGTFIFIIIPTILSFGLSFFDWNLLNSAKFVGLENYKTIFSEPLFFKILINTLVFALSTTVFAVIIPLILANVLNNKFKGSDFFKTAYFLPFITPMIVISIVWEWIMSEGIIANLLPCKPLYSEVWAMPVIIMVSVWKFIGYNTILFLSGFSTMNQEVLESARTDGANRLQTLFYVTIPMLAPTVFFVIIITAINSFQVFDLIYMMTQGGPADSTNVLVYSIYQNAFEYFNVGKASAIAYVLFIIVFVLTIFQWKVRKNFIWQEGGGRGK
ncbi:sugar ABC transporter permease [bacterium]|nr:sugar ABC transporter permease [bacterium]